MGAAKEALQVSALPQVYVWSQLGDGGYMGAYCLPLLGRGGRGEHSKYFHSTQYSLVYSLQSIVQLSIECKHKAESTT